MEEELIQVFFDPTTENIDWEKRAPRKNPIGQTENKQIKNTNETLNSLPTKRTITITDEFRKYISEINSRIEEYKLSASEKILGQLEEDYTILCVNFDNYGKPQEISNCIKRLNILLAKKNNQLKYIKTKNRLKTLGVTDRGIQIQERLKTIKSKINQNLEQTEYNDLLEELHIYKEELIENAAIFSKADNIQIKLSQIETYLNKLQEKRTTTYINDNKLQSVIETKSNNSGQTQRGIEIQAELANIRDEVKRKDLNPIEKENLTNALLKLQKEITSGIDKFSKFDSIPIRLTQIENYLAKLKDKEKVETKQTPLIPKTNTKDNLVIKEDQKKTRNQVIWRFGL